MKIWDRNTQTHRFVISLYVTLYMMKKLFPERGEDINFQVPISKRDGKISVDFCFAFIYNVCTDGNFRFYSE